MLGAWILTRNGDLALDTASPADVPTTVADTDGVTTPTSSTTIAPQIDPPALSLAAGEIEFDLPEGLVLVERGVGLLVFANSDTPTGFSERIVVVEVEPDAFRSRLVELAADGEVNIGTTGIVQVNGQEFTSWRISPLRTDPDAVCEEVQGCLVLLDGIDASGIPFGVQVSVNEIVSSSGSAVLVLSDGNGPVADSVDALLDSVTIS